MERENHNMLIYELGRGRAGFSAQRREGTLFHLSDDLYRSGWTEVQMSQNSPCKGDPGLAAGKRCPLALPEEQTAA